MVCELKLQELLRKVEIQKYTAPEHLKKQDLSERKEMLF